MNHPAVLPGIVPGSPDPPESSDGMQDYPMLVEGGTVARRQARAVDASGRLGRRNDGRKGAI